MDLLKAPISVDNSTFSLVLTNARSDNTSFFIENMPFSRECMFTNWRNPKKFTVRADWEIKPGILLCLNKRQYSLPCRDFLRFQPSAKEQKNNFKAFCTLNVENWTDCRGRGQCSAPAMDVALPDLVHSPANNNRRHEKHSESAGTCIDNAPGVAHGREAARWRHVL